MISSRDATLFQRVDALEQRLCLSLNRGCHRPAVREVFRVASRLGDGIFWYLLLLLVPILYGEAGLLPAAQMGAMALVGIAVYKVLKERLVRERPYITFEHILAGTPPLDRYSFPSGHTLHAVSFTTIATSHFPELGFVLVPFAAMVAASRVVLGLHYPTDVLAGAALGGALAMVGLAAA
ncbi:MAG: phosphatase PAP2 family protein [Steroidobacteraceae bacterium]|jgi:undecaprenyl-diphosphatase|nr:phosphatase PAP2 family protein [Steroidobacteraceae bacterium]